jgi:hypothetical protein
MTERAADGITGIPHPDRPDRWLVPPWPAIATAHEVVRHFSRFQPRGTSSARALLAFYQGYAKALTVAQIDDLRTQAAQHWFADFRRCIDDCVTSAEAEVSALQPLDQVARVKTMGHTTTDDDYEKVS